MHTTNLLLATKAYTERKQFLFIRHDGCLTQHVKVWNFMQSYQKDPDLPSTICPCKVDLIRWVGLIGSENVNIQYARRYFPSIVSLAHCPYETTPRAGPGGYRNRSEISWTRIVLGRLTPGQSDPLASIRT